MPETKTKEIAARLTAIHRATEELDRCVRCRGKFTDPADRFGATLGELDWLSELHRLLYEKGNMTREEYLREFEALTVKMLATTTAKNNDYAGFEDPFANFREFGTFGFLVRMSDKWKRIKNLVGENRPPSVKDESVEDTLIDLATYCLLLLCWLRSEKDKPA